MNIRDWLYVTDHCQGLMDAVTKGIPGETYCLGGNMEMKNIDIAKMICEKLDKIAPAENGKSYSDQIEFVTDRKGHDFRYAIDFSKAKQNLGWQPDTEFSAGLQKTVETYLNLYKSD